MQTYFHILLTLAPLLCTLTRTIRNKHRVVVIGGGAAGYFAAIECANVLSRKLDQKHYEVLVLESSKTPLSKVWTSHL